MMISGVAQVEIIHNRMELQMIIINNKMEKELASTHPSIHPSATIAEPKLLQIGMEQMSSSFLIIKKKTYNMFIFWRN